MTLANNFFYCCEPRFFCFEEKLTVAKENMRVRKKHFCTLENLTHRTILINWISSLGLWKGSCPFRVALWHFAARTRAPAFYFLLGNLRIFHQRARARARLTGGCLRRQSKTAGAARALFAWGIQYIGAKIDSEKSARPLKGRPAAAWRQRIYIVTHAGERR